MLHSGSSGATVSDHQFDGAVDILMLRLVGQYFDGRTSHMGDWLADRQKLHDQGKPFVDMPPLGSGRNNVDVLAAEMAKLKAAGGQASRP